MRHRNRQGWVFRVVGTIMHIVLPWVTCTLAVDLARVCPSRARQDCGLIVQEGWADTSKQMMFWRLVWARATFIALSTASEPLLAKNSLVKLGGTIFSILSKRPT